MTSKSEHEMSHAVESHKHGSPKRLSIALFTVSSSRFREGSLKDESGDVAKDLCEKSGHQFSHEIIDDNRSMIRLSLFKALFDDKRDAAIFIGGTGLAPRDVTIEAIYPLFDKKLDGFGEIFRRLSYDSIGASAMMTRTIAGTIENKPVFCIPGSPDAAKLGVSLALKELPHAVFIASSKP